MQNFNTPIHRSQLPQEETFKPLPEGKYVATITKAEIKDTKAMTGQYVNFKYTIVEGQHKGRSFFDIVNISNPNQQAVDIGLARLNTILTIGGIETLQNTQQLINITVLVTIGLSNEVTNGERQNKVVRLESPTQQQPQVPQQYAQVQSQQPVYQQPVQPQAQTQYQPMQNWQQPQAPVAQPQPQVQQWQATAPQPQTPTIQQTQQMLNDDIPF